MKLKTKHLLIGGAALLAGFSIWGGKKAYDIHSVVQNLKVSIRGVKMPEFFGFEIRSQVKLALINTTDIPLDVSTGGLLKITGLRIYNRENKLVATATTNIDNITILPNNEYVSPYIPIETNWTGLLNTLLIGSTDTKDYRIEVEINAVGQTFTI